MSIRPFRDIKRKITKEIKDLVSVNVIQPLKHCSQGVERLIKLITIIYENASRKH